MEGEAEGEREAGGGPHQLIVGPQLRIGLRHFTTHHLARMLSGHIAHWGPLYSARRLTSSASCHVESVSPKELNGMRQYRLNLTIATMVPEIDRLSAKAVTSSFTELRLLSPSPICLKKNFVPFLHFLSALDASSVTARYGAFPIFSSSPSLALQLYHHFSFH